MTIIEKARIFATAAHGAIDQKRKYTGEPYIVHPRDVVKVVQSVNHTPEMLAAAWLHDVVEDTKVSLDMILSEFGDEVARLVDGLTKRSKPEDGNRAFRNSMDHEFLSTQCEKTQTIKLADIICNVSDITWQNPEFAIVYKKEKLQLLRIMYKGDAILFQRAWELVDE